MATCFKTCLYANLKRKQLVLAISGAKWSFRILRVARASSSKASLQVLLDTRYVETVYDVYYTCRHKASYIYRHMYIHIYIYIYVLHVYMYFHAHTHVSVYISAYSSILLRDSVWPWPSTPCKKLLIDSGTAEPGSKYSKWQRTPPIIPQIFLWYTFTSFYIYICILYCLGGACSRTFMDLGS